MRRPVPSRELRKPLSLPAIHRKTVHRYPVLRGGWEEEEKGEGRGGGEVGDTCRCGEKEQGSDWRKQSENGRRQDVSHLQARPSGDTCKGAA